MLHLIQYIYNKVYPKLMIIFLSDLRFHTHTHTAPPKNQASPDTTPCDGK